MSGLDVAARDAGGVVAVTHEPLRCYICGTPHFLFVNRKGRTCCSDCDAAFDAAEAALHRQELGLG